MSVNARLAEPNRAEADAAAQVEALDEIRAARVKAAEEARAQAREARAQEARDQGRQASVEARGIRTKINDDVEARFGTVEDAATKAEQDAVNALAEGADAFAQANARYQAALNFAKGRGFDDPILEARAELGRARAYLKVVRLKAAKAEADAVRMAGNNPINKAKAKAAAATKFAVDLGKAEIEATEASLRFDRLLIDVAHVSKVTASRIVSAEKRIAEREKLLADPRRRSNPYLDPPPVVLTQSQWAELSAEGKARASKDGVRVIPDADPPFTEADAESVLDMQGSSNKRVVLTRSEWRSIQDPVLKASAAREAIIVDD